MMFWRFNRDLVFIANSIFRHTRLVPFSGNLCVVQPISSAFGVCCRHRIEARISSIFPLFPLLSKSIAGSSKSLQAHSSCDEVEVTDKLLNQLLAAAQCSSPSDVEICACIDKLCKAGNDAKISDLLELLHDKKIFLSYKAYNILLAAASKAEDTDLSLTIFKYLLLSSKSLGSTSYFNLARGCVKTSDCAVLLSFIDEVLELTFPGSVLVLNRVIFAFAACGMTDKALAIFNHMRNRDCKPDLFTYNIVLGILGRSGWVERMLLEFASMKEDNVVPDIVSYNTLINYLQKFGRLSQCIVYFREMKDVGIQPDLRTYTSMIEGFGRSGDVEESLGLLDEMKHLRIRPSIYIYRALISTAKKIGKMDIAASLLKEKNSSISELVGPKDFKRRMR